MARVKAFLLIAVACLLLSSCSDRKQKAIYFPFDLHEKCMIVNKEQDNTMEGDYLNVLSGGNTAKILVNLPADFYITKDNMEKWVIGWGMNKPLYDAGVENLREIDAIYPDHSIKLGKLLRGSGYPANGQRVVFWNRNPSGFTKEKIQVLDLKQFRGFHGQSLQFSAMTYAEPLHRWIVFISECDDDTVATYAAASADLINWKALYEGKPMFSFSDFKNISWANGKPTQMPVVTDVEYFNNKWYLFLDGYDKSGLRSIGLAVCADSVSGLYKIMKQPLIAPGRKGSWNDKSCFYAKVCRYKDHFIMFYDGRSSKGEENIGMAYSSDLTKWKEYENNPVLSFHSGWRNSLNTSEPAYVEVRNDSIFLLAAGAKKFKMGWWHHHVTGRMYMDVSGNVDDTELGLFLSTDGGKSFTPHVNNPVFTNDYAVDSENGHMGACFSIIRTDTCNYIFYLAKKENVAYNIFQRTLKK